MEGIDVEEEVEVEEGEVYHDSLELRNITGNFN